MNKGPIMNKKKNNQSKINNNKQTEKLNLKSR